MSIGDLLRWSPMSDKAVIVPDVVAVLCPGEWQHYMYYCDQSSYSAFMTLHEFIDRLRLLSRKSPLFVRLKVLWYKNKRVGKHLWTPFLDASDMPLHDQQFLCMVVRTYLFVMFT